MADLAESLKNSKCDMFDVAGTKKSVEKTVKDEQHPRPRDQRRTEEKPRKRAFKTPVAIKIKKTSQNVDFTIYLINKMHFS